MTGFFANSLMNGFIKSSLMGQGIVAVQIAASIFMVAIAIGKWRGLSRVSQSARRVTRDVMSGHDVLEYYLARHPMTLSAREHLLGHMRAPAASARARRTQPACRTAARRGSGSHRA